MARTSAIIAVILLILAALSCKSPAPLSPPTPSGPAWHKLTTIHFNLYTDLTRDQAETVLNGAEEIYSLLNDVAFSGVANAPIQTNAIVFATEAEFREFFPARVAGAHLNALPNDLEPLPTIVFFGALSQANRTTLAHELSHRFLSTRTNIPTWLDEGLATYYSMIRSTAGVAILGEREPSRNFTRSNAFREQEHDQYTEVFIPFSALPPLTRLFKLRPEEFYCAVDVEQPDTDFAERQLANYAAAWGVTHLLLNGPEKYTSRFVRMWQMATTDGIQTAFTRAFAGITSAEFQQDFLAYLDRARFEGVARPYRVPAPPAHQIATLAEKDVYLLWARLILFGGPHDNVAASLLNSASKLAPSDLDVRFWRGRYALANKNYALARQELQIAFDRAPQNPEYALGLALVLTRGNAAWPAEDTKPEVAKLYELLQGVASTPRLLNDTAWYFATNGRAALALPLAKRAVDLRPDCWQCWDTLARVQFELGNWADAERHQHQAVATMPERTPAKLRQEAAKTLALYIQRQNQTRREAPSAADAAPTQSKNADKIRKKPN